MSRKGKLIVAHGPMFSGKTSWLIDLFGDGKETISFKPDIDKRYTARPVLRSHDDKESPAILISLSELSIIVNEAVRGKKSKNLKRILIDESNFFPETIFDIVEDVLNRGIDVCMAGLLTDSEREFFGPTKKLIDIADEVIEFKAKCDFVSCNTPAVWTYAKKKKDTQVVVGASDMYGAACDKHYVDLHISKEKRGSKFEKLNEYGVYPGFISWLEQMELPYIRRLSEEKDRLPHIEVGGDSMRVGKTTALQALKEEFTKRGVKITASWEEWKKNPFVVASYGDSSKTIFESQKWFARRKFEQLQKVDGKRVHIQDVHPEMDYCYALSNVLMGRMTLKQFEEYVEDYYSLSWDKITAPDLLVYLKTSDDVLVERAQKAAREFETIDPNYFLIMKTVNRKWLAGAKKRYRVLEIDTDDFDFSKDKIEERQRLGEMVINKLTEIGFVFDTNNLLKIENMVNGNWDDILEKRLIIMSGLPGSGKSYYANKLKKENGYSYLSTDVIRLSKIYKNKSKYLDSTNDYVSSRELTYELLHKSLVSRLENGKRVVLDATYLGPQRDVLLSKLKRMGLLDEVVFLVVKCDVLTIESRVKQNGVMTNGKLYKDGWQQAYNWFVKSLANGEIRYPDESVDGVRVVEVWNG